MPGENGDGVTVEQFDVAGLSVEGVQVKLVRGRHVEVRVRFPYDDDLFARFGRIAGMEDNAPAVSARITVTKQPEITGDEEQLPLVNADGSPAEPVAAGEAL